MYFTRKNKFMNKIIAIGFFGICLVFGQLNAQEITYGFKAGLNFNSFNSQSETDAAGMDLEEFTGNTGFHVGAMFNLAVTDIMGARAELLFSQKGGRHKYEGESYYVFRPETGSDIFSTGTRKTNLNITHSYIAIPVTFFYRPISAIEVSAGISTNFLVASSAFGDFRYSGITSNGSIIDEFSYSLDYNYYSDNPGESLGAIGVTSIDNRDVLIPRDAGAYYEQDTDLGGLHRAIDFGAVVGIHLYLSKGLFLGFRADIGLSDFTKSDADISKVSLDGSNFRKLDLEDKNMSLQASVGFSF
jgi:hypothetical protein